MGGFFSSPSNEQSLYDALSSNSSRTVDNILFHSRLSKEEALEVLVKISKMTPDNISPLAYACLNASDKVVLSLLNFDASCMSIPRPNNPPMVLERMHSGATVAHYACESVMKGMSENNALNIINVLMEKNVDMTVRNKRGYTALDIARLSKSAKITRTIEDRISLFAGWIYVEQSTGIQKGIGKVFGSVVKDALKSMVGGEWKKCWVVVIRIIGSKSAASPPSMKCPRCDTILSPPTETVNRIIASKQKLQPAVRCSSCSQPLRVPLSIPDDIFELAIYQSSNDATPVRTYSLKGAVSNPVANPKSTFVPNGVTNFAQSMVFSQKSDNSSYYARRNILFGFESRQIRDAFVGSFSSEPRRVIEYYPDINGSSTASSAASSASSSSSSSSSSNNLVLSPSEEKRNAYVPSSAVAAASIDWVCPTCTYINHAPASATRVDCEMCRSECTPVAATATAPPTAPRPNFNNRSNTSSGSSGSGTQGASVVAPPSAPLVEAQVIDESTVSGSTQYPMAAVVANVVAPQFVGNADGGRRRSANFDDEIDAFICPITSEIMTDPVMTCDGFTYERSAITEWFQRNRGNPTSPITGERLENTTLVPNHSLRRAIDQYRAQLGISGTSASRGGNTGASASSSTSASITLT